MPNRQAYFTESSYIDNELIDELLALCETDEDKQTLKRMGFIKNPYESAAGVLTMAERKINLVSIERSFSSMEEGFLSEIKGFTEKQKQAYLKTLRKAIEEKDYATIAKMRPPTE
jgi:hypothetical protein